MGKRGRWERNGINELARCRKIRKRTQRDPRKPSVGLLQLLSCCLVLARTGRRMTGSRGQGVRRVRARDRDGQGQDSRRQGASRNASGAFEPGFGMG